MNLTLCHGLAAYSVGTEWISFYRSQPRILHQASEIRAPTSQEDSGEDSIPRSSTRVLLKFATTAQLQGLGVIFVWKPSQKRSNHIILRLLGRNLTQNHFFSHKQ